jgi:hypothetical protein
MKEKIWIEKLVELLNEYDSSNWWKETDEWIDNIWKIYEFHSELQIISKKYGFIKWLVENEKIDLDKTWYKKADFQEVWNWDWRTIRWYEMLLMLLSISSSPIDDLISYLK